MNRKEVENIVKKIIFEQTEVTGKISLQHNLKKDIQMDELDILEMTMDIENELNICIDDEKIEKCKTVGDVIDYLCKREDVYDEIESRFEILDI